jgi:hypothetical protein
MAAKKKADCVHDQLEVQLCCPDCGEAFDRRTVSRAEIEAQAIDLPEREAMSLVSANVFAPINLAAALNVLSDNSTAVAVAQQYAPANQST